MDFNFDSDPFDFVMAYAVNLIENTNKNEKNKGSIYLGDINSVQNKEFLKNKKITHVLSAIYKEKDSYEFDLINNLNLNHLLIPADDSSNFDLKANFHKASDFIYNSIQNGNVLVHCYAGVSRSTSCLIAYYIKYQNMNVDNALTFIKVKRSVVFPNKGFIKQLRVFEEEIKNKEKFDVFKTELKN